MLVYCNRSFHGLKAVIFDMDGTIIDSIDLYYAVIKDVMGRLGMDTALTRQVLSEGMSQGKRLADIIFPSGLEDRERAVEDFRTLSTNAYKQIFSKGEVELIDGVDGLLEDLRLRGFSLAIVTSSLSEVVVPFLKARNLDSFFACVLGQTEVSRLKPHPDPLLRCAEILGITPCESVYVGDSIIDIRAGKAAGSATIGVLTGASDLDLLMGEAPDAILDSVGDLPAVL
ncbi:MAG: HAD family hydrolase [Deltaproteobacteria bacterium]|nr:HAD family hydrolase [Deltaproteobacteria bacterium]